MPTTHIYYLLIHDGTSESQRLRREVKPISFQELDSIGKSLPSIWYSQLFSMPFAPYARPLFVSMPYPNEAAYEEWEKRFEDVLSNMLIATQLYIIGHGLGALFVQMFLATHTIKQSIIQTHFVSPEFECGDFIAHQQWSDIVSQAKNIHIWHSVDDTKTPFRNAIKYNERLIGSHLHTFRDRGHFMNAQFDELFTTLLNPHISFS